jgi:Phage phiEco32-like COOH.NH2 ligase-type 2
MSTEFQKLRGELLREALLKGWTKVSDVPAAWTSQLPPGRLDRWYKRLYEAPSGPMPVGARLINHFMLGADPEFVFHNGIQRYDARELALKAGPAFGADNNGRLCELRPAPSRSALSVLASTWLAMRWMAVFHPSVLDYYWRSGAYFEGDGLGGHVHFGRKRLKLREREVYVLDRVAHLQFVAGIFDREEGRLRVRQAHGAPAGQPYGALGDVREQPHGYEYRTLPSWIDSPWLAYFNLVVSKLVVALPDLVAPLTEADASLTSEQARQQLRMLLAYYSPLDDDARLAFAILTRQGWPTHAKGLDFKANWGLFAAGPLGNRPECSAPRVWPEVVPPTDVEEHELSLSMFEGRPPELTPLKPSWPIWALPKDYQQVIVLVDTKVAPGLGEFCMDLVVHASSPVNFSNCGHKRVAFRFPAKSQRAVRETGLQEALSKLGMPCDCTTERNSIQVNATKDFSVEKLLQAQKLIVASKIWPLWHLADVKTTSFEEFQRKKDKEPPRTVRLVFDDTPEIG